MDNYLSTFRIPIEKIPAAKDWKVGGRYKIIADVEQTGIQKERDYSTLEGPMTIKESRKEKPKFKTMVEFKVYGVSAKGDALKKKAY
jgi:hypothetical protein